MAQTHPKKQAGRAMPAAAAANYIAREITKRGPGDHGIFFDTLKSKLKLTDPVNGAGRQYQDIKVTLEAGDIIKTGLSSEITTPMTLSLLNDINGHLSLVKGIIDTVYSSKFNLLYKATTAGTYTLRVACKNRAPKGKDERSFYYQNNTSYTISCVISTPASGIMDSPAVCDQLQFLLRQRATNYMQITGKLSDTTMDVLDKKKIQSINYLSTFTMYKNSVAKINVDQGFNYVVFDQSLFYNSDADAAQAQKYFVEQFKTCLGTEWTEEIDPNNTNWYKFKKGGYNHSISLIFYPGYKFLQILM